MRCFALLAVLVAPQIVIAKPDARAFLAKHCVTCHGPETQKSGLRLDTLGNDFSDAETAATWAAALERVAAGEMPPKSRPRPTAAEIDTATSWMAGELRTVRQKAGGRVPLRRLNRVEYEYTLRDLLALPHLDIK